MVECLVKDTIRTIEDFPKKGIMFRDITTVIKDAEVMKKVIDEFKNRYADKKIDYVVGIESRGFIFGMPLAYALGVGFIPIRKPGKLPAETLSESYDLEYGSDSIEMHTDALEKGANVLIVDDLLATGGTANAACSLVKKTGANIVEMVFVMELTELNGREKLPKDVDVFSLAKY